MTLYLLRHADADTVAAADELRALSAKGVMQANRVARFCEAHAIKPDVILTSPVRRAIETAAIVSRHLGVELITEPFLSCGMVPGVALDRLGEYRKRTSVMIVGHEPDFSELAAVLLGMTNNEHIHLRKASLTCIDLDALANGRGLLEYIFPVKMM